MTDFATAGYVAGLFETGHVFNLTGKKPVMKIYIDSNRSSVMGNRVLDTVGGRPKHSDNDGFPNNWVEWVDFDEIMPLLMEIGDYVYGSWRQIDTMSALEAYTTRNGRSKELNHVAAMQLARLGQWPVEPLTFDLETMGFDAKTLPILSSSFQWGDKEDERFAVHKRKGGKNDRDVVVEIRDILESAAYSIGWNSARFDITYLNTRLRLNDERPAFVGSHDSADVLYDLKRGRKKRTSLINAANECGVTDEQIHKTPIDWKRWNAANDGNMGEYGMEYVLEHGDMDVVLTKRVYNVDAQGDR